MADAPDVLVVAIKTPDATYEIDLLGLTMGEAARIERFTGVGWEHLLTADGMSYDGVSAILATAALRVQPDSSFDEQIDRARSYRINEVTVSFVDPDAEERPTEPATPTRSPKRKPAGTGDQN